MKKLFTTILLLFFCSMPIYAQNSAKNEEILKLQKEINRHNYNYYVLNKPEISDSEYDKLYEKLLKLEKESPNFAPKNSPTQKIGGIIKNARKIKHKIKMQSLKKVYSIDNLAQWHNKNNPNHQQMLCEPKIDGLAITLIYKNGKLTKGATRGNGETGEDFTENIKTIKSIPETLKKPVNIEVRGEVFITRENFENLKENFSNPRNAASGSVRQNNPEITRARNLSFFAYQCIGGDFSKDSEALAELKALGFETIPYDFANNFDDVKNYIDLWENKRKIADFPTDGVVIKLNDLKSREKAGISTTYPNWAIAYKYSPKTAGTTLKNVEFSMGKSGILTPIAVFEPVEISGQRLSKATLHNLEFMKNLDIKINDKITIEKAGEILPIVASCEKTASSKSINIPKNCPFCGEKLSCENNNLKCTNKNCEEIISKKIEHFASRDAMNIKGLGASAAKNLVKNANIKNFSDIYGLSIDDLKKLDGFSQKSAENLYFSIQNSKKQSPGRLLYALGINNLGKNNAKNLAAAIKSPESLLKSDISTLAAIDGIGICTAKEIYGYFQDDSNRIEFEKLIKIIYE